MLTYLFWSAYFYLTYAGLEKYMPEYFPDTTEIVTRKYRIANATKATALAFLCVPGTQFLYQLVYTPEAITWEQMNFIGAVYTATDAAALVYNPKCHNSTLIHHIVVQLFYYYCYFMNFNMDYGVSRAIAVYCVYSAWAFLVNLRLAIRFLPYPKSEYFVNEAALFIYITVSMMNWVTQSYFLFGGLPMHFIERLVYMGTLGMTINDDLFLIKFLRKLN